METNAGLIAIVAVAIILLIILILRKNAKDKKELTDYLNADYKKKPEERDSELSNDEK